MAAITDNNPDMLIIDEEGSKSHTNQSNIHEKQADSQHQLNDDQKDQREKSRDRTNSKEKYKVKRYDYFNKYNQHQIEGKDYEELSRIMQERKSRPHKMFEREDRLDVKRNLVKPTSVPKRNQGVRSKSNSSSSMSKRKQTASAHLLYLQAYQNNIPQIALPYPLSPTEKRSKSNLVSHQNSLQKLLTKIPKSSSILSQQILHQNQLYKCQINEYRTMVAKMQADLANAHDQLLMSEKSFTNQKLCYEAIIKELKDQIIVLRGFRERYEILNQEMIKINASRMMMDEKENRGALSNYLDESISNFREHTKGKIKRVEQKNGEKIGLSNFSMQKNIFQCIQSILNGNELKKPTIKLSGYSQEILERIQRLVTKSKKHENFIFNIKQMQRKIQKNADAADITDLNKTMGQPTVRQLWKWLKILGSNYSFLLQIRPLLGKKLGLVQAESRGREIKEILQLALIKL